MSNKLDMTDFDVANYPIEDLLSIMGVLNKIPLTKADIIDYTGNFIAQYDKDPLFKKFFFDVRKRLLSEKDVLTRQGILDDDDDEGEPPIIEKRYKKENKLLDEDHLVIGELKFPTQGGTSIPFAQGNNNPTKRYTVTRIVNFDSHYRTILDPSSVACLNADPNSKKRLDSPSNYTANLSQPLQNVLEITLEHAEIPFSWYNFNAEYGTNYYVTDQSDNPVMIPSGNYSDPTILIQELNNASTYLEFSYSEINNKVSVKNTHTTSINVKWYSPSSQVNLCVEGGGFGQKLDYNLGWLLGFRIDNYNILSGVTIEGEALLDLKGPRYLLISLDDFCNNKPNQDIISIQSNKANFSLPSYYNKHTMDPGCEPPDYNLFVKGCSSKPVNYDLSSNLTQKQLYTVDQLKLAMSGKPADRYTSPNSTDILHKIPINRPIDDLYGTLLYTNGEPDLTKRFYFGPVNLSSFRIRLLNDKGLLLNLNNMDWSFSLRVTQLYSY